MSVIKTYSIILMVFGLFGSHAFAQKYSLSGKVVDEETNGPLEVSHVVLERAIEGDTFFFASITNTHGSFKIDSIPKGRYKMTISHLGYEVLVNDTLHISADVSLGLVKLPVSLTPINKVVVQAEKRALKIMGDTLQFNAAAFKTLPGSSAHDIVKQIPGMEVRRNEVKFEGKTVNEVMVDGKAYFTKDANTTLNNIPAEMVQYVQIYDESSPISSFLGQTNSNPNKTINLITKNDMRNGIFGNVEAGYGTTDRYLGKAVVNNFREKSRIVAVGNMNNVNQNGFDVSNGSGLQLPPSSSMNGISDALNGGAQYLFETKSFDVNSSYIVSSINNFQQTTSKTQYLPIENSELVTLNLSDVHNKDQKHNFNLEVNSKLSLKDNLQFDFRAKNNNINRLADGVNQTSSMVSGEENRIVKQTNRNGNTIDCNTVIRWMHKFDSPRRRLTVRFRNNYNDKGFNEFRTNLYNSRVDDDNYLEQEVADNMWSNSANLNFGYADAIGRKSRFNIEYEFGWLTNDQQKYLFGVDSLGNEIMLLDTNRSNSFKEAVMEHGSNLGYTFSHKKITLVANLNYKGISQTVSNEFEQLNGNHKEYHLFNPDLIVRYKVSNYKRVNLTYRTNSSPPTIMSLVSSLDDSNPMRQWKGNSNLKPTTRHSINTSYNSSHTSGRSFRMSAIYTFNQNSISNYSYRATSDTIIEGAFLPMGASLSYPVNTDGEKRLQISSFYNFPVKKYDSRVSTGISYSNQYRKSYLNGKSATFRSNSIGVHLSLNAYLYDQLEFSLGNRLSLTNTNSTSVSFSLFNSLTNDLNWHFKNRLLLESNVSIYTNNNTQINNDVNKVYWDVALGLKLLRSRLLELKIKAYDVLQENNSYRYSLNELYLEEHYYNNLESFFMVSLNYKFRVFPNAK